MTLSRIATAASLAFAVVLGTMGSAVAQTTPSSLQGVAPADEYFGPLHLSVIGIRNSIATSAARLDLASLEPGDTLKNVALVEASVRDWEGQYPNDTWLPKMVGALERVYQKIPGDEASLHAVDVAAWLMARYPASTEAHDLRRQIAASLTPASDANRAGAPVSGDESR